MFRHWGLNRRACSGGALLCRRGDHGKRKSMLKIRKFIKSDKAATAIEYGLIAALISVVIIAALQLTGTSLQKVFNNVGSVLSNSVGN
jgi:pilus assembly protein Flp/PilA